MKSDVDVSVLVVNYNTAHLLAPMLDALKAATGELNIETILVDNASRDDSVSQIRQRHQDLLLIANQTNVGFGRANNQCLPLARGRYLLLLNTDAFVAPDTLRTTVSHLDSNPDVGAVGVRLVGQDGALQPCCRYFPTPINQFLHKTGLQRLTPWVQMVDDLQWDHLGTRPCDWVPGCYLLMRADLIHNIGLFDPIFFLYSEEVDLCRRIKAAGSMVHYMGGTQVVHLGGESAKSDGKLSGARQISALQVESELLYFRKNHRAAGLMAHAFLCISADVVLLAKALLKFKLRTDAPAIIQHTKDLIRLLKETRFGREATR